ncbi:MAG: hypothetical protein AB1762_16155 [Gemmatimonadota bacterium]
MPNVTRACAVGLLLLTAFYEAAAQPTPPVKVSGYLLSLLTRSTTLFPDEERFVLDLNRLRFKLDWKPLDAVTVDVQYDNEVFLGSYLQTRQFALVRDRVPDTTFDLERDYAAGRSVIARHRLYRATVAWSGRELDLVVGRQRIAWGTGRFWSPLDILSPFDAARIEREERLGVDALLAERKLGALGKINAVFAPATQRSRAAAAGYVHGNAGGMDYSFVVGRFRDERVIGGDFAGRAGGLGIRGEATATRPDSGRSFARVLLGADYGFANTLTLSAELYYNGQGARERAYYDFAALFEGRVRSLARRYGAAAATYEITPLFKGFAYGILNVDDGSRLLWPGIEYSLSSNVAVTGGVQWFAGGGDSEYGQVHDLLHIQAKLFF